MISIRLSNERSLSGGPMLCEEVERFVTLKEIGRKQLLQSWPKTEASTRDLDKELGHQLFLKICDIIQKQIFEWADMSLNRFVELLLEFNKLIGPFRFLLSVHRMVTSGPISTPFVSFREQYHTHLCQTHVQRCQMDESILAHKTHVSTRLEFPELRLIEYDCGQLF